MADIREIINTLEPELRNHFLEAINGITSQAQLTLIAEALRDGRLNDAVLALHLSADAFDRLEDTYRAAYLQGGRDALIGLPAIPDPFLRAGLWCVLLKATREQKASSGAIVHSS